MAVSMLAVNAANLTADNASSSSSDTTMTVPTIDLNRGKSLRRRSEDLRGMVDSDEEDVQVMAVPIKGSRVITDWVCNHCKTKLMVDINVKCEEVNVEEDNDTKGDATGNTAQHLAETMTIEPTSLRNRVWLVMEITDTVIPPYPLVSRIIAAVGLLFILISVVNFVIETHPDYYPDPPSSIFTIEAICMSYFTLELVLRVLSTPNRRDFLTNRYTVIDFVSVVPFYVSLFVGSDGAKGFLILRILRLMRVFRIFKVTKYNEAVNMVLGSLRNSTEGLYLLLFLIFLSTVIFSSAMYFVEREYLTFDRSEEAWYEENTTIRSPFQSILHSSWWCLVTLTTVGYGDEVPSSTAGKVVAAATMLVGTLVIAFPMVIIGQNFQDTYRIYKKKAKVDKKSGKWKVLTRPKNFDRLPLDGTVSHLLQSQSMIKRDTRAKHPPPVRITRSNSTICTPHGVSGTTTPKPPVKRISGISQIEPFTPDALNSGRTAPMQSGRETPRVTMPPLTFRRRTKPGKIEKCAKQIESLEERLEALIRARHPKNGR